MESVQADLYTLSESRRLGLDLIKNTSFEELLFIPDGFSNNIFWLLGHTFLVQKKLTYALSKLEVETPSWFSEYFANGTSPKNWKEVPSLEFLLENYTQAPVQLKQDLDQNKFIEFVPFTTKAGTQLNTLKEAIAFNNFHEGLHLGQMLNIRRIISLNKSQSQKENQYEH
jgi:hypothetical protein